MKTSFPRINNQIESTYSQLDTQLDIAYLFTKKHTNKHINQSKHLCKYDVVREYFYNNSVFLVPEKLYNM